MRPSRKRNTCSPEEILAGHSTEVLAIAARLRQLIRQVEPDVTEAGYPGWRLIGYRHQGYFGFIAPHPDHVRLGFEHGVRLPDPDGLLQGTGKQVRYIRLGRARDIPVRTVKRLIAAALEYDAWRAFQGRR